MEKNLDLGCNAFVSHTLTGKVDSVKIYGEPNPMSCGFTIAGTHTRTSRGDLIHYVADNVFQYYYVLKRTVLSAPNGSGDTWVEVLPLLDILLGFDQE